MTTDGQESVGDPIALPEQGAMECLSTFMTTLPAHEAILRALHDDLNQGQDVQPDIDRYLLACAAQVGGLRAASVIEALVLPRALVRVEDCLDIGVYVRQALLRQGTLGCAGLQKLVVYSIPFVKHNRLTFPHITEFSGPDLAAILQVVLVACMGLVPGAKRRPTFRVRVLLVCTVHELIARGNVEQQYAFLVRNAQVLRVALTEYMLYFCVAYMPTEMRLLLELHRIESSPAVIEHMRACMDAFRTHALQRDTLVWGDIAEHAQACNDKCNRVCKGKNRSSIVNSGPSRPIAFTEEIVQASLKLCARSHVQILKHLHPSTPYTTLLAARELHAAVRVFTLPPNLCRMQLEQMRNLVSCDTVAAMLSTTLHLCLSCLSARNVGDTNMRLDASGTVGCNRCNQRSSVVGISMLGRLLRVDDSYFAYCPQCCCTHEWQCANGLHCTRRSAPVERQRARECEYCMRTLNIFQITVLDDELGVMHNVYLCRRHMPWQHRLQFVTTLRHLAFDVANKYTVLNPFHKR